MGKDIITQFDNFFDYEEIEDFSRIHSDKYVYKSNKKRLAEIQSNRECLIKNYLSDDSYENKLKLIFSFPKCFNFFSKYDIKGFGTFTGYPKNLDEKNIFVEFLLKYIGTKEQFFDNIKTVCKQDDREYTHLSHSPLIRGIRGFESEAQIVSELHFYSEASTFHLNKKKKTDKLIDKVFNIHEPGHYNKAAEFFWILYKENGKIEEVINHIDINKPYLFHYTIFHKHIYEPILKLLVFLDSLTYDINQWKYVSLSKINFQIGNLNRVQNGNYEFDLDGKLICKLSSGAKKILIEKILATQISKQEFNTILEIASDFESELKFIWTQPTLLAKTESLENYINTLNINVKSFTTSGLENKFIKEFKVYCTHENIGFPSQMIINAIISSFRNKVNIKSTDKEYRFTLLKVSPTDQKFSDFHHSLKLYGFIKEDLSVFRRAFLGENNFKKITWLKHQNELNYLISKLIDLQIIKNYGAWKHTQKMFILENGLPIHEEIRTNSFLGLMKI